MIIKLARKPASGRPRSNSEKSYIYIAINTAGASPGPEAPADASRPLPWKEVKETALANAAREYFLALMKYVRGDMQKAGELSGMSDPNLYASLRKYRVSAKKLMYGE